MRYGVRRCGVCAGSIRRVNATDMHPVLVVDFGAQYAQLIARRVREANVYSEIVPHTMSVADMLAKEPAAIILSGGPSSVYEEGAPSVDPAIFEAGVPVLGICYGFQTMAHALGGTVGRTGTREYGHTGLKDRGIDGGGTLLVHGGRAAGQDDGGGLLGEHVRHAHGVGDDLGVDVSLTHAARDQLGILRAEVDDEDGMHVRSVHPANGTRARPAPSHSITYVTTAHAGYGDGPAPG